jgi:hypothetical protein
MLAILAGCTQDEIKDSLGFWMSNRAGDVEPTLDIQDKKIPQKMRKKMANEPVLALWAFCSQTPPFLCLLHGGTGQ